MITVMLTYNHKYSFSGRRSAFKLDQMETEQSILKLSTFPFGKFWSFLPYSKSSFLSEDLTLLLT